MKPHRPLIPPYQPYTQLINIAYLWALLYLLLNLAFTVYNLKACCSAVPLHDFLLRAIPSIAEGVTYLTNAGADSRAELVHSVYSMNWLTYVILMPTFVCVLFVLCFQRYKEDQGDRFSSVSVETILMVYGRLKSVLLIPVGGVLTFFLFSFLSHYSFDQTSINANQVHIRDLDLFRYSIFLAVTFLFTGIVAAIIASLLSIKKYLAQSSE